jgi:hypothetical protein
MPLCCPRVPTRRARNPIRLAFTGIVFVQPTLDRGSAGSQARQSISRRRCSASAGGPARRPGCAP